MQIFRSLCLGMSKTKANPAEAAIEELLAKVIGEEAMLGPIHATLWSFVRGLRGAFAANVSSEAVWDVANRVVQRQGGWADVFEGIGWSQLDDDEDFYTEFIDLWDRVRFFDGQNPLDQALAKARAWPLSAGGAHRMPKFNRFISLAGWLQVTMGDRAICLPCRKVAELLKTTPNMVSLWRRMAISEGFLKVVRSHTFRSQGKSEATDFRFDVSRWKCLSKVAQCGCGVAFDLAEFIPFEGPTPQQ